MKTPLTLHVVAVVSALLLASCASDPYYYSGGTVSYDRGGRYASVGYAADYYNDYSIYRSYWSDWGVPFSAGVIAGAIFLGWDDHRHCYTYYYPRCSHCGYYPCRGGHRPYYRPHYRYHKQPLHPSHRGARHAKRKLYHPPAARPHSGARRGSLVAEPPSRGGPATRARYSRSQVGRASSPAATRPGSHARRSGPAPRTEVSSARGANRPATSRSFFGPAPRHSRQSDPGERATRQRTRSGSSPGPLRAEPAPRSSPRYSPPSRTDRDLRRFVSSRPVPERGAIRAAPDASRRGTTVARSRSGPEARAPRMARPAPRSAASPPRASRRDAVSSSSSRRYSSSSSSSNSSGESRASRGWSRRSESSRGSGRRGWR